MTRHLTVDGHDITAVVARSLDEVRSLRETWTRLLAGTPTDSAFLTWEWLYTWSEQFIRRDRQLFVVVLLEGSHVFAIAPWYIRRVRYGPVRVRQIGFLGLPEAGSDYLDVITKPRRQRLAAHALFEVLFEGMASQWDVLALDDVPADSVFLAHFIDRLQRAGKHYSIDDGSFCPMVDLPSDFEEYLRHLSSHGRQAYKRKMRALISAGGVEHTILRGEQEMSAGLPVFRELYERRWGRSMDGLYTLMTRYVPHSGQAWPLELSLLKVQGRAVAGLLHLTKNRTKWQYLMAVDRKFNKSLSLGSLICGMNIQQAIEQGFTEYDFLKTGEEYKLQWMNRARRSMNLRVHNRTLRSVSAWSVRSVKGLSKILFR